jgi:hypothetical protein
LYIGISNDIAIGPISLLCAAVAGWSRVNLALMASSDPPENFLIVHCNFLEAGMYSTVLPGRFTDISKVTLSKSEKNNRGEREREIT